MDIKNISNIHNCYGCGVCATVCNKNVIKIKLNSRGFYEPYIEDNTKCNGCGLCLDVCAFSKQKLSNNEHSPIVSFAAWSNEKTIQHKCSSGGVGFEIAHMLINEGYKVCGVRYNTIEERAEHYIASTTEELIPTIGSKYIQSYTLDGFKSIDRKKKYLVIGTPCQIDSFRWYIRKFNVEENFVLMDFFCHSVPSMLAWKKYLIETKKLTGEINSVSWRNKNTGWHDSWAMCIKGEKSTLISRLSKGDVFYNLFLGDFCCNKACQKNCKYKYDRSSADIRIGDLWGKSYANNNEGVSALVAFTPVGVKCIDKINCKLIKHPFEVVAEGQMKDNCNEAYLSPIVWKRLKNGKEYSMSQWKRLILIEKILQIPNKIIKHINKL